MSETLSMSSDTAETLALRALAWLIGDDDLRAVFLGASGVSESDLRTQAGDPAFLASVLDFILTDDAWVMRFCDAAGFAYDVPMRARAALPGGQQVHWT